MEITSIKMVEDSLQIGSTAHWKVTSFSEKLLICYQTKNKIYLLLTSPTFQVKVVKFSFRQKVILKA